MKTVIKKSIIIITVTLFITVVNQTVKATDVGGIIDTDTTWNLAGSPYYIKSRVQIAEDVDLTIEPGVVVNGESGSIDFYVWGNLNAIGNAASKIFLNNVGRIDFQSVQTGNPSATFQYVQFNEQISNSGIQGPGAIIIQDSEIHSDGGFLVSSHGQYDLYIERNRFICDSLSYYIHINGYNGTSSVEQNIFINTALQVRSSSLYERTIKNNIFDGTSKLWTQFTCTEDVVIEHNSFLNTNRIVVSLYDDDDSSMVAKNNYWNTTDIETINSMIWDRNDNLIINSYIEYWPILTEPHPDTPNPNFNQAPTANAGFDQIVFDAITLNGGLSDDPDGDITSYQWQLVHRVNSAYNRSAEGETPTVSDLKHGFYDVTLIVEDSGDSSDTDQMSFSATGLKGDFNFNGNVDGSDLAEFAENFGTHQND